MGSFGIDKITFGTMAKSLFDTDDFEPGMNFIKIGLPGKLILS